jgi:phosphatidylglycerophosphatase A
VTQKVQVKFGLHDPQWIVIDEVIGMLITWSFVMSVEFHTLFLVFAAFRVFDIVKIWPASYFDRLHHGFGTITDDVFSAIYAGTLVKVVTIYFT